MKNLVKGFSEQLKQAIKIAEGSKLTKSNSPIKSVVICGMGGSGIGGSIVAEMVNAESNLPIQVNKNYTIPRHIDSSTLVIVSSYSGNTEETLEALKEALKRKAKIVCIASGGKIAKIAEAKKLDLILVPGGMPPRSCVGYSIVALLFILSFHKIIKPNFKKDLNKAITLLEKEAKNIEKQALVIAKKIGKKMPVIYSTGLFESIALRFRQNLNENAKILTWHNIIPEMSHNELVGWKKFSEDLVPIFHTGLDPHKRVIRQIEIINKILKKKVSSVLEIKTKGTSTIEKMLYHVHMGDWISVLLAELHKTDPREVKVIEHLKSELKK